MIIILKSDARKQQIEALKEEMVSQGFAIHESAGINTQLLGLIGDTSKVDVDHVMANEHCGDRAADSGTIQEGKQEVSPE